MRCDIMNAMPHPPNIILYLHTIFCKQLYARLVFIRFGCVSYRFQIECVSRFMMYSGNAKRRHMTTYRWLYLQCTDFSTRKIGYRRLCAVFSLHIIFANLRYVFYIHVA